MKILYINDLRKLPNFGCRTTGSALEELLSVNNKVIRRDGRETVLNSGWDPYATACYKLNGIIPTRLYAAAWARRSSRGIVYNLIRKINKNTGGIHDYIVNNAEESVRLFHVLKKKYLELQEFESDLKNCDSVVINGEGTLIFASPTRRDALYLLFVIAIAKSYKKPVHLLNAMITECPYTGADPAVVDEAKKLLRYCASVSVREDSSFDYVNALIGDSNLKMIPDALFTWGHRFRSAAESVKSSSGLCIPYGNNYLPSDIDFSRPYVCMSSTSSAWRFGYDAVNAFAKLAIAIRNEGLPVYLIATCAGDYILHHVANLTGIPLIEQEVPVHAGAGILAGSTVYITGRYHPAIMAASTGVPTIFMASNSHKTKSIQKLLGYEDPKEYPVVPTEGVIDDIVARFRYLVENRQVIASKVYNQFEVQSMEATKYRDLLS